MAFDTSEEKHPASAVGANVTEKSASESPAPAAQPPAAGVSNHGPLFPLLSNRDIHTPLPLNSINPPAHPVEDPPLDLSHTILTLSQGLFAYLRIFASADPTWIDLCLLITGSIAAAAAGIPFPLMGIIFGELVDNMNDATCAADGTVSSNVGADPFAYEHSINDKVLKLVYIAIAALVCIYVYVLSWSLFSQRLAQRLRAKYVGALLRQPPGFFDARAAAAGEVSTRLHADMTAVQAGTSEKVGVLIASTSFFIACYVVAFIKQAKLAGILVSMIPAFLLMAMGGGFFVQKYMARATVSNAAASSIAGEALQHVAVVQAFGAAPRLERKFAEHAAVARDAGAKKGLAAGFQSGMLYWIAYSANALAFWQGSRMVVDTMRGKGTETVGQIYTVVFLLVDGLFNPLLLPLKPPKIFFD